MRWALQGVVVLGMLLAGCSSGGGDPAPSTPRAAGELDTSYGEAGIRRLSYPASADDATIDAQGALLLATHDSTLAESLYTRILPNGGLDPELFRRAPASQGGPHAARVFALADGRFIGAYQTLPVIPGPAGSGRFVANRYGSSGTLDAVYGMAGTAEFHTRAVHDVVAAGDGSIVVLGMQTPLASVTGAAQVARFDPAGRREAAYESNAEAALAICGNSVSAGYRGAMQPDGRLVAALRDLPERWCFTRLNADGTLDTSFGSGGRSEAVSPLQFGGFTSPTRVLVKASGAIAVLAESQNAATSTKVTAIFWLTGAGRLDGSRGVQGISVFPFDFAVGPVDAATAQPDGKLLLVGHPLRAGRLHYETDTSRPRLVRLDDQGNLDLGFGPEGGIVPLQNDTHRLIPRVVVVDAGAIHVAGGAVPLASADNVSGLALAAMKVFVGAP